MSEKSNQEVLREKFEEVIVLQEQVDRLAHRSVFSNPVQEGVASYGSSFEDELWNDFCGLLDAKKAQYQSLLYMLEDKFED